MKIRYTLSGLLLALTTALILEGALSLLLVWGWVISINVFTLVFYIVDKVNSKSGIQPTVRIPEISLLLLALAGGSPAAALAILFLPHKISKPSFLFGYFLVLLAQGAAGYALRESIPWPWLAG